jgi:UPF0176 protein
VFSVFAHDLGKPIAIPWLRPQCHGPTFVLFRYNSPHRVFVSVLVPGAWSQAEWETMKCSSSSAIVVAAFYQFADLPDYAAKREALRTVCEANDVFGTILLASEGINGTIAASRAGIDAVLAHLRKDERLANLQIKESFADTMPFRRTKVRLKREIVSMGVPDIDPAQQAGTYVMPEQWNELLSDPNVLVVDTRNDYEVAIGSFPGAIDPRLKTFRDFPEWARSQAALSPDRTVAMYCTGGIRCEKSTAYLKSLGFNEVYHLQGGILKYLETVPLKESLWDGECFVFDGRVSVRHGLEPGSYAMCHGCRRPVSAEDHNSELFVPGVCCPQCHGTVTPEQRERFGEREKQEQLAQQRGERHLGKARRGNG